MNLFHLIRNLAILFIIHSFTWRLQAQSLSDLNLIFNGNFEKYELGFTSQFYNDPHVNPGSFTITNNAPFANPDFKNPIYGDHTKGRGNFLVFNSNGRSNKKFWCASVMAIPNSRYEFTAYFCNVYALLPSTSNFEIDKGDTKGNNPELKVTIGTQTIAIEKDFYHLFRWIKITGTWYSGSNNNFVEVCLENTNTSIDGNDVAVDDISFTYIETMPSDYTPPVKTQTVVDRSYQAPVILNTKVPLSSYGEFILDDTVTEGVYVMHAKPWKPIYVKEEPSKKDSVFQRIALHSLIFEQTKADLKESVKADLDVMTLWLERDTTVRIRFIGHTDNQGDSTLNVQLSEERVLNVKKYLVTKGINPSRIETVGYGGNYPIADNKREETRKLNRRVEMEILKQ